jgi:hypothetical protein
MLVTVGILTLIAAGVGGTLVALLKCEPAFYAAGACPGDYDTREKASRVLTRLQDLKTDIRTKGDWGETFSADELNCFFAETMTANGTFVSLLPENFHDPRVAIEGDRIKLGFRYGEGLFSAIVWIELRVWLVAAETNVMAVEVCDLRAGRMTVGTQSVLDSIAEAARGSNVDVTWYRLKGNPVGLFRFFPDQPQPVSQVLTLETRDGQIVVAGRTQTDLPPPTMMRP